MHATATRRASSMASFLLLGIALLSGCGGGSSSSGSGGGGGGGSQTTTITAHFGSANTVAALRIGTGAWTQIPSPPATYTFTLPTGTTNYAIAYTCSGAGPFQIEYIAQYSSLDFTDVPTNCTPLATAPTYGNLTGVLNTSAFPAATSFSLASDTQVGGVGVQQIYEGSINGNSASFVESAADGAADIYITLYDTLNGAVAVRHFPSVTIPGNISGASPVVFTAADAVTFQPITLKSLPANIQSTASSSSLIESNGLFGIIFPQLTSYENPTLVNSYPVPPAAALQAGDFFGVTYTAELTDSTFVSADQTFSTAAPLSLTMPAPFTYVAPTINPWPSIPVNYSGFTSGSYLGYVDVNWNSAPTSLSLISLLASPHAMIGQTSLAIPDLSSISGLISAPASGTKVNWSVGLGERSNLSLTTAVPASTGESVGEGGQYIQP